MLVSGIDTLHLFSRAPVLTRWARELEEAKAEARALPRRASLPSLTIAGHTLAMQRSGARTAPIRLDSDHLALLVSPTPPDGLPSVAVELRALYLWQRGAIEAATAAQALVDAITRPSLQHELQVSRLDLTVDFQGWIPSPEDYPRLVTRAKGRSQHHEGANFTGFSFGRHEVVARLYDKTEEIRASAKSWFFDVWRKSESFRNHEPVWRLEYQLRREALRALQVRSAPAEGTGSRHVESWLDVSALARGLWRLMAGHWLTMRLPRTKETRQRLTPEWGALVEQGFGEGPWDGTAADLYRSARMATSKRTDAAFAGYLARELAQHRFITGREFRVDESMPVLVAHADDLMRRRGSSLDRRATEHLTAWQRQRESMAIDSHEGRTIYGDPLQEDE